ncbi:MAG: type II toxin-antitoxin system HicA family toxin [Verrucomicrobiota bacterium]|nr:type II toxin-antitoxin system HicA family toxin [Verrucomicrobiota bacterium]
MLLCKDVFGPSAKRLQCRREKSAGFVNRGGKGSHRNFEHPRGQRVTLSGRPGDDAHPYQEKEVKRKINESEK